MLGPKGDWAFGRLLISFGAIHAFANIPWSMLEARPMGKTSGLRRCFEGQAQDGHAWSHAACLVLGKVTAG